MIELHLQAQDGKGLHVGIKLEFKNEDDFRKALERAIPVLAVKALTTVYVNTFDWNFGIAKVQQNGNKDRNERYLETGN